MIPGVPLHQMTAEFVKIDGGPEARIGPISTADAKCGCGHPQSYHAAIEVNGERDGGCWIKKKGAEGFVPCACENFMVEAR